MSARYEVGELVDVHITGARVSDRHAQDKHLWLFTGDEAFYLPMRMLTSLAVNVTRSAPKEWPPQPGDVWLDADGNEWFGHGDGDGKTAGLLAANGRVGGAAAGLLDNYGPMRLAYRRGWTPNTPPAEPTPVEVDKRAAKIAGLRELADWLDANPAVPLPWWTSVEVMYGINNLDNLGPGDKGRHDELLRIADLIGEVPDVDGTHPGVKRKFSGDVTYRTYYIPKDKPAVEAATDIAQGEGRVAGSEGAGPATAPADEQAPAEPAPVVSGDGPVEAPEQTAWVAVVRRGIAYHNPDGQDGQTVCHRSMRAGRVEPLSVIVEAGGKPCDLCYPAESEG